MSDIGLVEAESTNNAFVLEEISPVIRVFYASLIILIASLFCFFWLFQNAKDSTLLPFGWLWAPVWLLGLWVAHGVWRRKVRQVYATVSVPVMNSLRYRYMAIGTLAFLSFSFLAILPKLLGESFSGWWAVLLFVVACYAAFMRFMLNWKFTKVMTKAAMSAISIATHTPPEPAKWELALERLWTFWWIRYALGLLLAYFSYVLYVDNPNRTVAPLLVLAVSIFCFKEVSFFLIAGLIVCSLAYAAGTVIAALPVALAIIIGALIIASAINK